MNTSGERKQLSGDPYKKNVKLKNDKLQNGLNQTHKSGDFLKKIPLLLLAAVVVIVTLRI